MRRSNFALRVPPTLLAEARKAAESEGVALNQLITSHSRKRFLLCARKSTLRNVHDVPIRRW
jgi:HicB-like protein involved in pilus formation